MLLGKKFVVLLLSLIIFVIDFSTLAKAKSVYVISNINGNKVQAYKVDANSLTYQVTANTTYNSPVGIAIDESEYGDFLFLTFENQDKIELVNAKTMQYVNTVTATGATNLAGIAMDTDKSKLYAVDRYTNHLYSWSWNPLTKTLTRDFNDPYYIDLNDLEYGEPNGAFGIALDEENGLLYVADNTDEIKYYDTNDWSKKGEVNNVSCNVISIAIDVNNQLLYYGSMGGYGQGDPCLYQYNLSSGSEQSVYVGSSVAGIAVDQDTSLVYIATFESGSNPDKLIIYDVNLVKQPWDSGDIGNPAGVAVGSTATYKPPDFYFEKIDINEPNCVIPDDHITYRITYGPNGVDHNNVVITDFLPHEVNYISSTPDGNYNGSFHTVTWNIGTLEPNESGSVTLAVKVSECIPGCGIITNTCKIKSGDLTLRGVCENTPVCSASHPWPTCGEITITASFKNFLVFSDFLWI